MIRVHTETQLRSTQVSDLSNQFDSSVTCRTPNYPDNLASAVPIFSWKSGAWQVWKTYAGIFDKSRVQRVRVVAPWSGCRGETLAGVWVAKPRWGVSLWGPNILPSRVGPSASLHIGLSHQGTPQRGREITVYILREKSSSLLSCDIWCVTSTSRFSSSDSSALMMRMCVRWCIKGSEKPFVPLGVRWPPFFLLRFRFLHWNLWTNNSQIIVLQIYLKIWKNQSEC